MNRSSRLLLIALLAFLTAAGRGLAADGEPVPEAALHTDASGTDPLQEPPPPVADTAFQERLQQEQQSSSLLFSILPHKQNYLLPATYNRNPNDTVYGNGLAGNDESLDRFEVKFQLSLKVPLWENIFGNNGTLYAAYSQLAFWQAYNTKTSSPFREINFEPETFLAFNTGYTLLGVTSKLVTIGFNHQSNGRSDPLSRSWNRIIANLTFSRDNTYVTLKPWFRIPENTKDDDNPAMERYYGYGELQLVQKLQDHTLSVMLRNNLRSSGNKGAVQVDWSFPLHKKLKGYIQFFNGYGESLIDYNHSNSRIGLGVMLADWL